jgi:hypothetical protein
VAPNDYWYDKAFHVPHLLSFYTEIFIYFNLFSASFCIAFLSDGIDTSINKQGLSLFITIMSGLYARIYMFVPFDSITLVSSY